MIYCRDELSYNWQRVDGLMPSNSYVSDQGRVLNIPDIELPHAGTYKCTCTRLNGQSSSGTVQLPVDGQFLCYCMTMYTSIYFDIVF